MMITTNEKRVGGAEETEDVEEEEKEGKEEKEEEAWEAEVVEEAKEAEEEETSLERERERERERGIWCSGNKWMVKGRQWSGRNSYRLCGEEGRGPEEEEGPGRRIRRGSPKEDPHRLRIARGGGGGGGGGGMPEEEVEDRRRMGILQQV